jgi:hypothetical protein
MDWYLNGARQECPGFYPVRSIKIRYAIVNRVSTLLVSYPTIDGPGPHNYVVKVMHIPLSPVLAIKPVAGILASLPKPNLKLETKPDANTKLELLPNHLAKDLVRVQVLLSMAQNQAPIPEAKKSTEAFEEPSLNFNHAFAIACDIHVMFTVILPSLTPAQVALLQEKLNHIISLNQLADKEHNKPAKLRHLQAIYADINYVDGMIKLILNERYTASIGQNISNLLKILSSALNDLQQTKTPTSPSHTRYAFFDKTKTAASNQSFKASDIQLMTQLWAAWGQFKDKANKAGLAAEAKNYGFDCHDAGAAGNCLYHAVAHQLNQNLKPGEARYDDNRLRALANDYILNHPDYYANFLSEEDGDMNEFVCKNLQSGTFADNQMIEALSSKLGVTFAIMRSDGTAPYIIKQPNSKETVYLGYDVTGVHYLSLVKNTQYQATKSIADAIRLASNVEPKTAKPNAPVC